MLRLSTSKVVYNRKLDLICTLKIIRKNKQKIEENENCYAKLVFDKIDLVLFSVKKK